MSIVLGFLLACSLGFPAALRAADFVSAIDGERYRWHVKAGMQVAHQNPDFTYDPVKTSDMSAWNENPDRALIDFSFVSLQRDLTGVSNLELSYCRDDVDGTLYGRKSMPILFFHLPVTLRGPLEMELRRLKLQYSRILLQPGQFSLGASVGAQALQIWMDADMPNLLNSMGADDHLDYLVVVPSVGAFAEYQTNGPLKYRIVSEYLSAPLKRIQGKLIGVNAGVDYRLSDRFFLGLGYRFSDIDIRLHQRRYDLKGSYEVHGYEMRAGFDF
ncbi:MAG: hypothetical protein HGB06_05815 [Chlorobaculum sp.]|nr:hypothetical protein [Chlorobaculum sp.]